jgi:hypothetical protein
MNYKKKQFCPKGHDTFVVGRTSNYTCRICANESTSRYAKTHRDKDKEYQRMWFKANPEKDKKYNRKYEKANPGKTKENLKRCELKRKHRVPNFGQEGIIEFYKNCPLGYEVDHYYPLCGKVGSGLHVIWNLRYILPNKNRIKSNKWPKEK